MKKCPYCGNQMEDDNLFCTNCGKECKMEEKCPHCGASVNDDDMFCRSCGIPLNREQTFQSTPSYDEAEISTDNKKIIIPIVIGLVVLALIGGLWWSWKTSREDSMSSDSLITASITEEIDNNFIIFQKKFTIKNVLNLVMNPTSESAAQKCGLDFIYHDTKQVEGYDEGQYFTWNDFVYGYEVKKGNKRNNYMGYDLKATSEHACYFQYSDGDDTDWTLSFKNISDADDFIEMAKEYGFKKGEYDYEYNKWIIRSPQQINGWYKVYIWQEIESQEQTNRDLYDDDNESSYSSDNSISKEKLMFSNEQYIIGHLLNQRFRHSSGLEIRFDGDGRMYIDGDAAGVVSVVRYDSESAILRYGNGMYGEGKLFMQYANGKIQLTDTADGSVFYQK